MKPDVVVVCAGISLLGSAALGPHLIAEPCSSYSFTPVFCEDFEDYCSPPPAQGQDCAAGSTPDNTAFLNTWPADGTCDPVSLVDYLATGADVRGTFGSLCVQHSVAWDDGRTEYLYRHVHDLTPQIIAHPSNTVEADGIDGAGAIDKPLEAGGVPSGYVDSMDRTLRPEALKGSFYLHPLDGVNKAGLANMIYYHEIFLDDDRAPTDFTLTTCPTEGSGANYADCNCTLLNPDATCDAGSCAGTPVCAGTCDWYECDGTCTGGPNMGQACISDSDCSQCVGGPNEGQSCAWFDDPVCKSCDSGPNVGQTCSTNADCGSGVCETGPRVGQACANDAACGECIGGYSPGGTCDENQDCQHTCGPGQSTVCEAGANEGLACTEDTDCVYKYPVLKRTDGQVHASFAIGLMSIYDTNPCDLDQGRFPSEWRLAVYDGKTWQTFKAPLFDIPLTSPPDMMDLYPLYGWNRIDFAIGADYIEVRLTNIQSQALYSGIGACIFGTCKGGANHEQSCTSDANCAAGEPLIPNEYLVARVPRQYKGPFNKYALGPGKGRDLTDPQNPGPEQCLSAFSSADIISDEIVLYDGTFVALSGACCSAGDCSITSRNACESAGGVFHGFGSTCDQIVCCPEPFADSDRDGDVDQVDFAAFQACFTGPGGTLSGAICTCFDRTDSTGEGPPDNAIDASDWSRFEACASGAGISADADCGD